MEYQSINLQDKLSKFSEHWSPKIIAQMNDNHFKLAKVQGEFVWHHHDNEDELFYVVKGSFDMHLRSEGTSLEEKIITINFYFHLIMV